MIHNQRKNTNSNKNKIKETLNSEIEQDFTNTQMLSSNCPEFNQFLNQKYSFTPRTSMFSSISSSSFKLEFSDYSDKKSKMI